MTTSVGASRTPGEDARGRGESGGLPAAPCTRANTQDLCAPVGADPLCHRQRPADHRLEAEAMLLPGDDPSHLEMTSGRHGRRRVWAGDVLRESEPLADDDPFETPCSTMLDREQEERLLPDVAAELELLDRFRRARKGRPRTELNGQPLER